MVKPVDWKPTGCADCGALFPSWSLDGPTGPWRCSDCNSHAYPRASGSPGQPQPQESLPQGSLL